ncbi:hypothetical protein EVAR_53235_1 [Eumeta japonica]|uniref:Uncharacterized protein n=1 Tax=Eumeta variegata TaxID=151549 RepID=A0A4C1XDY6_EUMVA|nr:hypothetical protein EVAR_53235_1 [Eumeta japonica]
MVTAANGQSQPPVGTHLYVAALCIKNKISVGEESGSWREIRLYRTDKEWATDTFTHWRNRNSGIYNFMFIFCESMVFLLPIFVLQPNWS